MLEVKNLKKYYKTKGGVEVHALDGVSIEFPETGMVFLLGKSGSGKSTLLNVSGGLDRPDSGEIIVKGKSSLNFTQADFDSYRNTFVGFVFQEYNILNEFNVETNIGLALELQGKKNDKKTVNELLKLVDLEGMGKRKPNTLSGGQKQRIAIARALIKEPEIIMADEPTGALDSNTGKQVLDTLKKLSKTKLVIVVSHDRDFAEYYADRIIELKDGKVLTDHSKSYAKAESISDNVKKIGENTIQIQDISKLSDAEVGKLLKELNGKGEVIISNDDNSIKTFKKAAKISDNGEQEYFKDTDTNNIDIKHYDGSQTKFIKSKLPMKHALRIGASNLKIKPGRLVFTMFLSVVAFTMFGVLSTLMFYNPAYSYAKGIQNEPYQALIMSKEFVRHSKEYRIDGSGNSELEYESEINYRTNISKKDLEDLNENTLGMNFAGVYEVSISLANHFKETPTLPFYQQTTLRGLCDCGESFLLNQGFEKVAGDYPSNSSEIAISTYTYELFKKAGYLNPNTNVSKTISIESDLIGQTIKFNINNEGFFKTFNLTISGIYKLDTSYEDYAFNILKQEDTSSVSQSDFENLVKSFEDVYNSSFYGLGYVSADFYSNNTKLLKKEYYKPTIYVEEDYFYGLTCLDYDTYFYYQNESSKDSFYPSNDYSSIRCLTSTKANYNSSYFKYYDVDGNAIDSLPSLGMDEAFINLNYYSVGQKLFDMAGSRTNTKYGAYNKEGELIYYDCKAFNNFQEFFINYDNATISFVEKTGYTKASECIIDENNAVVAYLRKVYTNSDGSDYRLASETGFDNYTNCWFDKDGNFLGNENSLKYVDLNSFFYDSKNNKCYTENDVMFDGSKYVLKSNHEITTELISNGYYLDSAGKLTENSVDGNKIVGLFIDKTDGSLGLTKTANSVFADNFFIDKNNKIYFGDTFEYCYFNGQIDTPEYSFTQNGCPLGCVDMSFKVEKEIFFLSDKVETVNSLARFFKYLNKTYELNFLRNIYTDIDIDDAISSDLLPADIKNLITVYKQYASLNAASASSFLDDSAILSANHDEYIIKGKGFFLPDPNTNCDVYFILADNWSSRGPSSPFGYSNDYTWSYEYSSKYEIDNEAQYDLAISKTDKTTEQLTFMMKHYDNDSLYVIENRVISTLSMIAELLKDIEIVFLVLGLVMAGLSGLMLLNFISTSIAAKQKEIGILRAVGARGSDVFKIYFSESGIICFICFLVSIITSTAVCGLLDSELAGELSLAIFHFGLLNVAIIFGVSLVVGFIGTIFPVIKASIKPPVESIRAL